MPGKSLPKKVVEKKTEKVQSADTKPTVTSKEVTPKSRSKKEVQPKPEPPEEKNVVVESESNQLSITDNFTEFITKFQGMLSQLNGLKAELKQLERKTCKQLKLVEKLTSKKRKKGPRAPSGFVKPSLISDELANFLGKAIGTEMARTDVTREINKYIRANSLQDKDNGRKINPDKQLKTLLKIDDSIALTYFNLQRYMGPHFPKQTKAAPAVQEASA
tara:strand:- start:460 stop:1113 length:654 start_codon:yes stop_codon:yes gene_type:complete